MRPLFDNAGSHVGLVQGDDHDICCGVQDFDPKNLRDSSVDYAVSHTVEEMRHLKAIADKANPSFPQQNVPSMILTVRAKMSLYYVSCVETDIHRSTRSHSSHGS